MDNTVSTKIPVRFEKVNQFDDRFIQVKIWLMHTGLNYNGSSFDKETVEKAVPSLNNTPILAYIEESISGEKDFAGHEMEIVVEDGEYKMRYLGKAVGVIPETNNWRWEQKEGDNGEMLEYLVVDGYMWTKFDESSDIIESLTEVPQSMELHNDHDGYFDKEGIYHFTDFKFYGACLLGQDVLPAMAQSSVEVYNNANVFKTIHDKMAELREAFAIDSDRKEETEVLEKEQTEFTEDNQDEKLKSFEEEPEEVKDQEEYTENPEENDPDSKTNNYEEEEETEGEEPEEDEEDEEEENFSANFQVKDDRIIKEFKLSHEDIYRKLFEECEKYSMEKGIADPWDVYVAEVYDDYVIMVDIWEEKYFKLSYDKDDKEDKVYIKDDSHVEVFPQYLTAEEKGALEMMRENFESLKEENESLKKFKTEATMAYHEEKSEEIFNSFTELQPEDYSDIKENVHDYTLEQIEEKMFSILGRKKANFSKNKKDTKNKLALSNEGTTKPIKGYDHLFAKHGIEK